jgi:hypothetical protein
VEVYGKMSEECFDLLLAIPKTRSGPHSMKVHIALYPRTVALLGTYRIVATPHHLVHFIEESACHGSLRFCKARQMGGKILNIVNRQICLAYIRIAQYQAN